MDKHEEYIQRLERIEKLLEELSKKVQPTVIKEYIPYPQPTQPYNDKLWPYGTTPTYPNVWYSNTTARKE